MAKNRWEDEVDYRILGPIEVFDGNVALDIGSRQQRALLAILVTHVNRVVATERILEDLWPHDPAGKERTLWVYISRLRTILDPNREGKEKSSVLVTRDHGYVLNADPADIDAHRFTDLADRGRELVRDEPVVAGQILSEALALWRGSALEEFAYEEFARADADRLADRRLAALEDRIDANIRAGLHREVIGEVDELAAAHPERERFVAHQMIALYRSGRHADALRAFKRHRRTIGEELGIEPSPELKRIEEQVLLHDPLLAPASAGITGVVDPTNPFNGLRAFGEDDADRFFGRDRLVTHLVRRITAGSNFIALVGSSGSGKSSVLHAGLIAAIRNGVVDGSDQWLVAGMVPGTDPFQELEAALSRAAVDLPDDLAELLRDPEDGVLRSCLRLLSDSSPKVFLVIDQFEELFTLGAIRAVQDRFIRNLEVVLDDPHRRVVIAIGLRADFYGRPLEYPGFADMLARGIVNVVPLTPDELESAAEEPAARAGVMLEPALLVPLLGDVAGRAGGLPLFQYALTELFDRRDGAVLTHAAYEEMGGVSGAIARRAEDLFLELEASERDAAKQLFLRLVTIDEQGTWGRRRLAASEITSISDDLVALEAVLDRFSRCRLLTLDRDLVEGSPTAEVAHEALLEQWPRLRRWIEDGRHDVLTLARLSTAMNEWEASGRQLGYQLSGQRLSDFEQWANSSTLLPSIAEQRFLDESLRQRESELAAEEQRVEWEAKLEGTARRRLWVLSAVAAAVAISLGAGVMLLPESNQPVIAVMHGAGGDLGASDLMIAGVGNVERERDVEIDLLEPLVDAEEDLRRLAESGAELIVVGNEFDLAVDSIARAYPDVTWVAVDPAAVHVEADNLTEIQFPVEKSAFLAGAAAALSSRTGAVGFIGAYQTFRTERSRNGFEQGARWADPDISVLSTFVGPVIDPVARVESRDDLAFEIASTMYGGDVDVIFHDAGPAGAGVVRAANERSTPRRQVWTIGSDSDDYLTRPRDQRQVVLTSTIKRFDTAVETAITAWLDDALDPGEIFLDLANEGVALSRSGGHLAAIDGQLKNLEGDLAFGHISVSPHSMRPPAWQSEPDVRIELTQSDRGCSIDRITVDGAPIAHGNLESELTVTRNDVIVAELTNASSNIAGAGIRPVPIGTTSTALVEEELVTSPAASLGVIQAISTAEVGGATGIAAVIGGTPLAISCSLGVPSNSSTNYYPLIVRPS